MESLGRGLSNRTMKNSFAGRREPTKYPQRIPVKQSNFWMIQVGIVDSNTLHLDTGSRRDQDMTSTSISRTLNIKTQEC